MRLIHIDRLMEEKREGREEARKSWDDGGGERGDRSRVDEMDGSLTPWLRENNRTRDGNRIRTDHKWSE